MNDNFDENSFWEKIKNFAIAAGRDVIEKALILYYAAQLTETPHWAKSVIFGALAYFVLPTDAIPDVVPIVGFVDDLGALAAAIATVSLYINDDVKEQAKKKLVDWFG